MKWYYVEGGQQQGPVSDAELEGKSRAGAITPETLVWREGMANWQPYRETLAAREPSPSPGMEVSATGAGVVCGECGGTFRMEEVIRMGDRYICANCKPVVAQKLQEGAPIGGGPSDPDDLARQIIASGYTTDIGDWLGRGWQVMKENFWLVVGGFFLVNLVLFGITMVLGLVPLLGNVAQLIIQGPLFGGLLWFYVRLIRGEDVGIGDAFSGFGPRFVQLMLAHIVASVFYFLCYLPAVICFAIPVIQSGLFESGANAEQIVNQMIQELSPLMIAGMALGFVGLLVQIYLYVSWIFALPLVIDREMSFWSALRVSRRVVAMHWWLFFVFAILLYFLLTIVGVLACCVGLLVTLPLFFVAQMVAYEDIFGGGSPGV
jgi:uncharacterized membrane protein